MWISSLLYTQENIFVFPLRHRECWFSPAIIVKRRLDYFLLDMSQFYIHKKIFSYFYCVVESLMSLKKRGKKRKIGKKEKGKKEKEKKKKKKVKEPIGSYITMNRPACPFRS